MKTGKGTLCSRQSIAVRRMVITAMLGAITILLTFTPIGMIMLPPPLPAVTLVHIPVIVAALAEGPLVGLSVGLVFGLCSFFRAWESGMVGLTLFFRNPLVSIVPRLIIPLMAWGAYALWRRFVRREGAADKLGAGLAAIVGTLTNTVLCLGAIVLLYGSELTTLVNNLVSTGAVDGWYMSNSGTWLVAAVGVPNGLAEVVVAAILVPLIKVAVDAINRRGRGRKKPATGGMDVAGGSAPAELPADAKLPTGLSAMPDAATAVAESAVENAVLTTGAASMPDNGERPAQEP